MSITPTPAAGIGRCGGHTHPGQTRLLPVHLCGCVACSMMEACYHGEVGCLELILAAGGSLLSRDSSGFSALHYAVDGGNLDMVSYVLDEGVPVRTRPPP